MTMTITNGKKKSQLKNYGYNPPCHHYEPNENNRKDPFQISLPSNHSNLLTPALPFETNNNVFIGEGSTTTSPTGNSTFLKSIELEEGAFTTSSISCNFNIKKVRESLANKSLKLNNNIPRQDNHSKSCNFPKSLAMHNYLSSSVIKTSYAAMSSSISLVNHVTPQK